MQVAAPQLRIVSGCLMLAVVAGVTPLPAQTTVILDGRIHTAQGNPLEGAHVGIREVRTGESRSTRSRPDGGFRFIGLDPGSYAVLVRAVGFQPQVQVTELIVGQRPRLRFVLDARAIALAPVEVSAPAPGSLEAGRTDVSTAVLEADIRQLPLSTRNVIDLAGLVPGIRSFRPPGGNFLPAAGALRGERFLNAYIDGVELKNLYDGNLVGFPQTGSPLPADALREFRVHLQPHDPAFSRAAAFLINVVTHRGTNQRVGSAFGFVQHRDLVAANDFLRGIPNFNHADFERQHAGASLRGPFIQDRFFYAMSVEAANTRSYTTVAPVSPPTQPGYWDDHAGVFAAPHRNVTAVGRLTYVADRRHTLDVSGSFRHHTNVSRFGGIAAYESAVDDRHRVGVINVRHHWRAESITHELSLQHVHWTNTGRALTPRPMHIYPGLRLGAPGPAFDLTEQHSRLVSRLSHAVTGRHGTHLTTAGIEVARVTLDNFFANLSLGRFEFRQDTASLPWRATIAMEAAHPHERSTADRLDGWITGLYVNHEWRHDHGITLNLGVRHDVEFGLLDSGAATSWAGDPTLGAIPDLKRFLDRHPSRTDFSRVSPRAAISWDLADNARTVLRAGFSVVHDRIPAFIALQERRDAANPTYVIEDPRTTDPQILQQRIAAGEGRVSLTLMAHDMKAPRSRQWSAGLARRFTESLTLNADFISQNVSNIFATVNLNWLDVAHTPARRALSDSHGDIIVWDDFARARYRALLTQVTWEPKPSTRLNLAYTLGFASADWDAENRNVPAAAAPQFYVMQRTSGDERHRFVLSGFTGLPFDLTFSFITTLASPRPVNAIIGQDVNRNDFLFDDWIDGQRTIMPSGSWRNWYRVADARLARSFSLASRARAALFVEAFNIFNAENYSSFRGQQNTPLGMPRPDFGEPDGVFATRQVQFGARFTF